MKSVKQGGNLEIFWWLTGTDTEEALSFHPNWSF